MYCIMNRKGEYLARTDIPVEWSSDEGDALGWKTRPAAEGMLRRLWSAPIARRIGVKVAYIYPPQEGSK